MPRNVAHCALLKPCSHYQFSAYASIGTLLEKLFYTNLGSGRVETVASNSVRRKQSVTCIQLAIAVRQSNMCAAPLNMSVVTPPTPSTNVTEWLRVITTTFINNLKDFPCLPQQATRLLYVVAGEPYWHNLTALTEDVSESDHFCNVNTTYAGSGTGCVRWNW